jgi:hypothetical protein
LDGCGGIWNYEAISGSLLFEDEDELWGSGLDCTVWHGIFQEPGVGLIEGSKAAKLSQAPLSSFEYSKTHHSH